MSAKGKEAVVTLGRGWEGDGYQDKSLQAWFVFKRLPPLGGQSPLQSSEVFREYRELPDMTQPQCKQGECTGDLTMVCLGVCLHHAASRPDPRPPSEALWLPSLSFQAHPFDPHFPWELHLHW